jgi:hypothetical protein
MGSAIQPPFSWKHGTPDIPILLFLGDEISIILVLDMFSMTLIIMYYYM